MNETAAIKTTLSIDLKKNRIRIFKEALHHLKDPKFVQLLVNPEKRFVAIRGVDCGCSSIPSHRISRKRLASYNSVEIYSRSFVDSLCGICDELDRDACYHLSGVILPQKRAAFFALSSASKFETDEVYHEREAIT